MSKSKSKSHKKSKRRSSVADKRSKTKSSESDHKRDNKRKAVSSVIDTKSSKKAKDDSIVISSEDIRKIALNVYDDITKKAKVKPQKESIPNSIIRAADIYTMPKQPESRFKVKYTEDLLAARSSTANHFFGSLYPISKGESHKVNEKTVGNDSGNDMKPSFDASLTLQPNPEFSQPSYIACQQQQAYQATNPYHEAYDTTAVYNQQLPYSAYNQQSSGAYYRAQQQSFHQPQPYDVNIPDPLPEQLYDFSILDNPPHLARTSLDDTEDDPHQPPMDINLLYQKPFDVNNAYHLDYAYFASDDSQNKVVAQTHKTEINSNLYGNVSSFAARLMKKMGWNEGDGLGREGKGVKSALHFKTKLDRRGLAADHEKRDHTGGGKMSSSASTVMASLPKPPAVTSNGKNPVSVLMEHCQKNKIDGPVYSEFQMSGNVHSPRFKICVEPHNWTKFMLKKSFCSVVLLLS